MASIHCVALCQYFDTDGVSKAKADKNAKSLNVCEKKQPTNTELRFGEEFVSNLGFDITEQHCQQILLLFPLQTTG